jgi:uncharacterized membrane protein
MRAKTISRYVFGALFVAAGVNHFLHSGVYVKIMPPYLPKPELLVAVSGACEMAGGALMMPRRTAPLAAWGLIALLLAVFPANIHMAVHAERFPQFRPALLWARLPFQFAFIAWAYWHTRPEPAPATENQGG